MSLIYLVIILGYVVWAINHEHHDRCENPDCENCPFPRCERGEK